MTDRTINIAIGICSIFVVSIYIFGMVEWKKNEVYNKEVGQEIFIRCIFSVLYILTFVIFLLSKSKPSWVEPASYLSNTFFALVLYNHIWQHYRAWDKWSYIVLANFFILYCIVKKIKKKIGYG